MNNYKNLGVRLNKILIHKRFAKCPPMLRKNKSKLRKKKEKERLDRLQRDKERVMRRYTLERREIHRRFPNAIMKRIVVTDIPEQMKDRYVAWCLVRGFSPAGRIRKFIYDCTTGVISE